MAENRYRVLVRDNGPGIVKQQIPKIFGKLLYGSKFHSLKQQRGQQGIGISAAGMYAQLTTGKPVKIVSKTKTGQAHYYEIQIDTRKNVPNVVTDEVVEFDGAHGTAVEMELEAVHKKGRHSVDDYLKQTALANPHAEIAYLPPDGNEIRYERAVGRPPGGAARDQAAPLRRGAGGPSSSSCPRPRPAISRCFSARTSLESHPR